MRGGIGVDHQEGHVAVAERIRRRFETRLVVGEARACRAVGHEDDGGCIGQVIELVRVALVVQKHEIVDAVAGLRCSPGTQGKRVAGEQ